MSKKENVILSLGSNIGNRKKFIEDAIIEIENIFQSEVRKSSFYETEPWGFDAEVSFLNCCISFFSSCNPKEILKATQKIEIELGRVKKSKNSNYQPRVIDIDILYVGQLKVNEEDLTIPHPLIYDRSFVLTPLVELYPHLIDPVKKASVSQLFEQCNDDNKVILYEK